MAGRPQAATEPGSKSLASPLVVVLDADGQIDRWDQRIETILELDASQLEDAPIEDVLHLEPGFNELVEIVQTKGEGLAHGRPNPEADPFPVHVGQLGSSAQGDPSICLTIPLPVGGEGDLDLEPLRRIRSLHEATLGATGDGILITDLDGTIASYNDRFLEIWDVPEDVIGTRDPQDVLDHVLERIEDPDGFIERIEEMYEDPERTFLDFIRFTDGRVVERRSMPRYEAGEVVGRVSSFTDITGRKEAASDAIHALSLHDAILDATQDGILVVDLDGDIVSYNDRFLELWDVPEELAIESDDDALLAHVADQLVDPEGFRERIETYYERPEAEGFDVLRFEDGRVYERFSRPQRVGEHVVGRVWSFRDVTAHRRALERLRRSEEQFRSLFENAPVGIYRTTPDGRILLANPALVQMLGYEDGEDLLTRNLEEDDELFEPDYDRAAFRDQLRSEGRIQGMESRWRLRHGETIDVRESARAVQDDEGEIAYYEGIVEDITDRVLAEQELRESQQRLEALVHNAPVIIASIEPDGLITFVAGSALERLGLRRSDLQGRDAFSIWPEYPELYDSLETALAGESATDTIQIGDLWLQIETVPMLDEAGAAERVIRVAVDITERKRAEEAIREHAQRLEKEVQERTSELAASNEELEEERRRLSAIVETEDVIVRAPWELDTVLEIILDRASELTGATGAAVEMAEDDELVYEATAGSAADHEGLRIPIDGSLSGRCYQRNEPARCDDTETDGRVDAEACRRVGARSMVLVPLAYEGRTFGALKVLSDKPHAFQDRDIDTLSLMGGLMAAAISHAQLFEAQEELIEQRTRALEDLQRKKDEIEQFAHIVSHDLRGPLQTIDGFSQILLEDHQEALDDQGQHLLDRLRSASQTMAGLIDSILMLSRVTRRELDVEPVDLAEISRRIVDELEHRDQERDVRVEIQDSMPAEADPTLAASMMENLITNAWKFTRRTSAARIEIGSTQVDGETVYHVRDNGAGFDPSYAEKLFQPFQRLHDEETFEGTGIGLASVERIVDRHGGWIDAEGRPGEGATFRFTLSGG